LILKYLPISTSTMAPKPSETPAAGAETIYMRRLRRELHATLSEHRANHTAAAAALTLAKLQMTQLFSAEAAAKARAKAKANLRTASPDTAAGPDSKPRGSSGSSSSSSSSSSSHNAKKAKKTSSSSSSNHNPQEKTNE